MIQIFLIAILSLLSQLVLPWWSLAVVAFLVCLWRSSTASRAFWYGFAGVALTWLVYTIFIHIQTGGIFTGRMSQLLFKIDSPIILILITVGIGSLVGGLAGLTGYFVRQAMVNQPPVRNA